MRATTPGSADARRVVVGASLIFAALLTSIALLLLRIRGVPPAAAFDATGVVERVAVGLGIGALAGLLGARVVERARALDRLRRLARDAIDGLEPRWHTMLLVSLTAGVSEEFLFRGALEPLAGRWLTAVAFVGLHGALRIRGRGMLVFAVFLFAASLGLSALYAWKGLECAMAGHTAYDLAVLVWLRHVGPSRRSD